MTEQELYEKKLELTKATWDFYIEHELFSWQWWFLVVLSVVPWVLWMILRAKPKQGRLLFGGMIVGLIAVSADILGVQYGLWQYGIKLIPSIPPLLPYDLAVLPVEFMIIQQYAKTKRQFILLALVGAAINAFIGEPCLKYINVYSPRDWQKYFSFPLYFLIFWFASWSARNPTIWNDFYEKRT